MKKLVYMSRGFLEAKGYDLSCIRSDHSYIHYVLVYIYLYTCPYVRCARMKDTKRAKESARGTHAEGKRGSLVHDDQEVINGVSLLRASSPYPGRKRRRKEGGLGGGGIRSSMEFLQLLYWISLKFVTLSLRPLLC